VAGNTLFLVLSFWAAAVTFWPIYHDPAIIRLVIIATAVGCAIAILGAVFRWSVFTLIVATVVSFLAIGVPLAVPSETIFGVFPSAEGLRLLGSGVALGWKQLLTITLPVGTYQALLVPALVLILGLSVIALSVALRSRRGGFGAWGGPIILVAGIALGPEAELWPVPSALAVLGGALLWLAWRRQYFRASAIAVLADPVGFPVVVATPFRSAPGGARNFFGVVRSMLATVLVLAIAGGAAIAAVAVFPVAPEPLVLRSTMTVPFDPRAFVSPLAGFRHYLQQGRADRVILTVAGLSPGDRIRVATLDRYDGVVYSVGSPDAQSDADSFTRVPFQFDQTEISGTARNLEVTVGDYSGVWLPTVGQLVAVGFTGPSSSALDDSFFYQDSSGTAAVLHELRQGDRYRLDAVQPLQPSRSELAALTPAAEQAPQAVLPAELESVLARYTASATTPGARLKNMLEGLRREGYISHGLAADEPVSRSGHSAERITELLTVEPMVGDSEQYASAAAIMAQQLGFPARVVFGFVPAVTLGTPVEIRGDDVSAWIEVRTEQFGWVALDATPVVRPIPERAPDEPQSVSRPQPVIPPPAETPNSLAELTAPQNTQDKEKPADPWQLVITTIAGILGAILLATVIVSLPFLVVVLIKRRRTGRRRRATTARARMIGGWLEFADAAVDRGFTPPPTSTRREFARQAGGATATVVAAVVDSAVFSPTEPEASDADKVWGAVAKLNKDLRAGLTARERFRAAVSLRSLRSPVPPQKVRKERGASS
jgi:hypothetical protein